MTDEKFMNAYRANERERFKNSNRLDAYVVEQEALGLRHQIEAYATTHNVSFARAYKAVMAKAEKRNKKGK